MLRVTILSSNTRQSSCVTPALRRSPATLPYGWRERPSPARASGHALLPRAFLRHYHRLGYSPSQNRAENVSFLSGTTSVHSDDHIM